METGFARQREELLQSIERDREDVRVALRQLSNVAGAQLGAGRHIRSAPLSWTIGAFLVGAWFGKRETTIAITK